MSQFIGNNIYCFDVEKIVCIHWLVNNKTTIEFTTGEPLKLRYDNADDYELINNLRETLGFESLPQIIDKPLGK